MFARMALPLLGGAPAVWNTAMAFFQVALLLGYAYAHGLVRGPAALERPIALALLLAGLAFLPISLPAGAEPAVGASPILWLLATASACVGLPFLALAANAPLLQAWYARHGAAGDPYFLYAASNLGSVGALIAYPTVVEPALSLPEQARLWAFGYGLLTLLVAVCAVVARRAPDPRIRAVAAPLDAVPWRVQLHWVALAAVPSALLLGVTGHITTDVAAVPLLWIVPLALYLLTFVVAFAARPPIQAATSRRLAPFAVVALVAAFWMPGAKWAAFGLHLAGFLVLALACHGMLVERRPAAAHLTRFYLCLSAGGALGGTLTALVAPVVFMGILEYPIAIAAACLVLRTPGAPTAGWRDAAFATAVVAGFALAARAMPEGDHAALALATLVAGLVVVFAAHTRPARFAATVAAALLIAPTTRDIEPLLQARSFFGVFRVSDDAGGHHRMFWHGTTLHGLQALAPEHRRDTLAYYDKDGPIGQVMALHAGRLAQARVGVVGLGAGALACYARPGQHWTFVEIDPLVVRIARDSGLFSLLADCAPDSRLVVADGRLALQSEPTARYDLLILDAFSSDGVPTHLLTREAMRLYRERLAPGGLVVLNISNRFLALEPVVAATAAAADLVGVTQAFRRPGATLGGIAVASHWVVMASDATALAPLAADARWRPLAADGRTRAWTDTYANVLAALR